MGRPKTYTVDDNYFEKIDTPNKAYLLGFIYADGSVSRNTNTLTITISTKDIEILEFMKCEMKYSGPIKSKINNIGDYSILTITSKKIKNDLIAVGVVPNKTYVCTSLPNIVDSLYPHLLRGLFDGDGSIWRCNYKTYSEYCLNFSNNSGVLRQIKDYLANMEISSSTIRYRYGKSNEYSCMLDIKGSVNIEKFYELLCFETYFGLSRKKERFTDFSDYLKTINRKYDKISIEGIESLYISGLRQFEIAELLGLPKSSVRGCVQRLRRDGHVV